jgi:hypothetical protein
VRSLRRRLMVKKGGDQWRLRVLLMSRWLRKRGNSYTENELGNHKSVFAIENPGNLAISVRITLEKPEGGLNYFSVLFKVRSQ